MKYAKKKTFTLLILSLKQKSLTNPNTMRDDRLQQRSSLWCVFIFLSFFSSISVCLLQRSLYPSCAKRILPGHCAIATYTHRRSHTTYDSDKTCMLWFCYKLKLFIACIIIIMVLAPAIAQHTDLKLQSAHISKKA